MSLRQAYTRIQRRLKKPLQRPCQHPHLLLLMLSLPALSPCPSHPVWTIDVAAAVRTEDEALLAGAGGVLTCLHTMLLLKP